MMNIPSFFNFRLSVTNLTEKYKDIAIAYKVPGAMPSGTMAELIEVVCRGPLVPDGVVIFALEEDLHNINQELTSTITQDALIRFKERLPLVLATVALNGLKITTRSIEPATSLLAQEFSKTDSNTLEKIINAGLTQIFNSNIISYAPLGYSYLKPSGKSSSFFVRAEAGLQSSGAVSFTAFAIWAKLLRRQGANPSAIELILIDTMAIAPVVFALRELFLLSNRSQAPAVDSFHSYGGLSEVPQPLSGKSLCLISASSSMEMHREWVKEKRVRNEEVITLVTFEDCKDSEYSLYALPSTLRPDGNLTSALHQIRIFGENFSAGSELPKKVLLRKQVHSWLSGVNVFFRSSNNIDLQFFDIFRTTSHSSNKRRALFVHASLLEKSEEFRDFLELKLPQVVRATTRQIIYSDDAESKNLAQRILQFCVRSLSLPNVNLLSATELQEDPTKVLKDAGLIIVNIVAGSGGTLLNISRNLRGHHFGPRLFVIGIQIVTSESQVKVLDANLKMSAHQASVDVLRYQSVAISPSLLSSFEEERQLYLKQDFSLLPEVFQRRLKALSDSASNLSSCGLLPCGHACADHLPLRKDFVFWPKEYNEGRHHAAVIATMSVLLQRARESDAIDESNRLFSARPTHVTLDPENFAHYDDGVIQASILRNALASELDYRADQVASEYLMKLLMKSSQSLGTDRSEGILEFLLAIATHRLKLYIRDQDELIASIRSTASKSDTQMCHAVLWMCDVIEGKEGQSSQPL
jgi:hypothetical protein